MPSRSALPLAFTLAVVACLGEPIDPSDTDGFRVTNLNPANGATGVPLHDWLRATVSADVAPETVVPGMVQLRLDGVQVPISAVYDSASRRFEFLAPLLPGATYQATIGPGVRSSSGDTLVGAKTWSFKTRAWNPVAVLPVGDIGIADAALSADGGLHLVGEGEYYFRSGNDMANTYVKYVSCAAPCSGMWSRVAIDSAWIPSKPGIGIGADGAGTVHLVHSSFSPAPAPDFGPPVIRYVTCSGNCFTQANWVGATIDSTPDFSLTPALAGFAVGTGGALHLLSYPGASGPPDLRYATCSSQCTTAGNWTSASIPVTGYPTGPKSLQVDESGRLHLLTTMDGMITYSTCPGDCTTSTAWTNVPVRAGAQSFAASMAHDAFGGVHVVYSDPTSGFGYAVCSADCASSASWSSIAIEPGNSAGTSIAVDVVRRITALNPVPETGELRYFTCLSDCLEVTRWQRATVERPDIFRSPTPRPPALLVDQNGSLRMVYNTSGEPTLHHLP